MLAFRTDLHRHRGLPDDACRLLDQRADDLSQPAWRARESVTSCASRLARLARAVLRLLWCSGARVPVLGFVGPRVQLGETNHRTTQALLTSEPKNRNASTRAPE